MDKIAIFCNGACSGNPGVGGYACIIYCNGSIVNSLVGRDMMTTNNKMELTAVIKGFETLKWPSEVTVITSSEYLVRGMTEWIYNWQKRGWISSTKKPVMNQELWKELVALTKTHKVEWALMKAIQDRYENERTLCNSMARSAIESFYW